MNSLRVKLILEAIDRMTRPVRSMAQRYKQALQGMLEKTKALRDALKNTSKAVTDFGVGWSTKITAPLIGFGYLSVKTTAQFEKLKASLKTVFGSQAAADSIFKQILDFASTTPFQLEQVLSAVIKLKALGLDPSMEALRSYGNTASAMGKDLNQFIEAVADASTGEFERLKEFGIKASQQGNKVAFVFQGKKTVIRKNAEEIQEYLRQIGDVQFAGAMEEQMAILEGAFSNFGDSVSTSLDKVGRVVAERLEIGKFIRGLSSTISEMADAFAKLPVGIQGFLVKGALIMALIGPLIIGFGQFMMAIHFTVLGFATIAPLFTVIAVGIKAIIPLALLAAGAIKAFGVALLTTPIGWITLGIAAIAGGAYLLIKNWTKVKSFFSNLWQGIKATFASAAEYIMNLLKPLIDAVGVIGAGLNIGSRLRSVIVDRFQRDERADVTPVPLGPAVPVARSPVFQNQKVDAGGTLHIKIDAEGQPRVAQATPNDRRLDYRLDTGLVMGAN